MKTYFFVTVLFVCLCIGLGLKPRGQDHNLVNGHLRETMPHNLLQRHDNQMVSPSKSQLRTQNEYQKQREPGDHSSGFSNGMNHKSLSVQFLSKTLQSHKLFNTDEPSSSQSYHEHEMQSSYDDGTGYHMMRNRHHLMKGDVHDEYSVGDNENDYDNDNDNGNDYDNDNDDQLNDNNHHNQNDLDEPNNGERRYYVDDNDLRRKFTQEETSSLNSRDYIDYNKEIRPQSPSHGPYPYTYNPPQRPSGSISSSHDREEFENQHDAVEQQAHHDPIQMNHDKLETQSLTTDLNQQSTHDNTHPPSSHVDGQNTAPSQSDNHITASSAPSSHPYSENDDHKHKWRNTAQ